MFGARERMLVGVWPCLILQLPHSFLQEVEWTSMSESGLNVNVSGCNAPFKNVRILLISDKNLGNLLKHAK